VLFIITQQQQPALSIEAMQSQQAWIIAQQLASPEVQVIVQPCLVISHLHMPIVRLQQQTIMPFMVMQQLTMPPCSMVQRFCIIEAATGSSQVQVIFMPSLVFSILKVQRGTIIMLGAIGMVPGLPIPIGVVPGIGIAIRSIIIVLVMNLPPVRPIS
jgi:hypothetical protein